MPFAAEHQPVAVEQHAAVRPDVEVAEPELLVDQREQLVGRLALGVGHADLGQAQQLQDIVLAAPDAAQLVGRPAALDLAADLVVVDELARPAVRLEQLREHLHRRGVVGFFDRLAPPMFIIRASHPSATGLHMRCAGPVSAIGRHDAVGQNSTRLLARCAKIVARNRSSERLDLFALRAGEAEGIDLLLLEPGDKSRRASRALANGPATSRLVWPQRGDVRRRAGRAARRPRA